VEQATDFLTTPGDESLAIDIPHLAAAQSSGADGDRWVKNRDLMAANMAAEQVVEAQRLAREWDTAHPREP
jgi:hypothetical protein